MKRFLTKKELLEENDICFSFLENRWIKIPKELIGIEYNNSYINDDKKYSKVRREIKYEAEWDTYN